MHQNHSKIIISLIPNSVCTCIYLCIMTLQQTLWERNGVSNHQQCYYLFKYLFQTDSKDNIRVSNYSPCEWNNSISILWCRHESYAQCPPPPRYPPRSWNAFQLFETAVESIPFTLHMINICALKKFHFFFGKSSCSCCLGLFRVRYTLYVLLCLDWKDISIAHVIIIIKSEVSTFLIVIIFFRGCVSEMFITSYSVTCCIYIPG